MPSEKNFTEVNHASLERNEMSAMDEFLLRCPIWRDQDKEDNHYANSYKNDFDNFEDYWSESPLK